MRTLILLLLIAGTGLVVVLGADSQEATDAPAGPDSEEEDDEVCPFPWQSHEFNVIPTFAMCTRFADDGVSCDPQDPLECTGRNPVCVYSRKSSSHRCCSDFPQDLSSPPGNPEQVKPICPYGSLSYDSPSVLLCDPSDRDPCPEGYECKEAINSQMLSTYNMHLCCKSTTLNAYENVFYETKVGINKLSDNLSMPLFYVTSLSPSIIPIPPTNGIDYIVLNEYLPSKSLPLPEVRTGDHFSKLPYKFRDPVYLKKVVLMHEQMPDYFLHVLVLYNPHGNPESMNFYYNRPSSLSREIDLTIHNWEEGAFAKTINRVLTFTNDKTTTRNTRRLYIVLVFKTKVALTQRHPLTYNDFNANYTTFTEFLSSETGKFLGTPIAGSYFYITR